jgi:hypothetical protein
MQRLMGNTSSSHSNRSTANSSTDPPSRSGSRRSRSLHHRDAPAPPSSTASSANHSPNRPASTAAAGDAQNSLAPDDNNSKSHQQQQQQAATPKRLPHRSLRTKKKSLELPDLALALTPPVSSGPGGPGMAGPYRRPTASSPIAIPIKPNGSSATEEPRLKTIPTEINVNANADTNVNGQQQQQQQQQKYPPMAEVIVQQPSETAATTRGRGHSHIRGGPLPYNSTRSFTGASARGRALPSFVLRAQATNMFSPEDIHSSIPLALRKAEPSGGGSGSGGGEEAELEGSGRRGGGGAEDDGEGVESGAVARDSKRDSTGEKLPAQACIVWRGGGKSVFLMRAGDNNWKGRRPLDYE